MNIIYLLSFALVLLSCNSRPTNSVHHSTVPKKQEVEIKLRKLEKHFVVGDFDGDRKNDTLFQHNYSRLTKAELDSAADPFQQEWDTVINWFYDQNTDLYLAMNNKNCGTLHLGTAQGLYCLINVGDNNADGKDEIAFVIDHLDFSRVNSCKIYSLCNSKWKQLMTFAIHEDAFNFTGDRPQVFTEITGYLEQHKKRWVYHDYHEETVNPEDLGKMIRLTIDKCNQ